MNQKAKKKRKRRWFSENVIVRQRGREYSSMRNYIFDNTFMYGLLLEFQFDSENLIP